MHFIFDNRRNENVYLCYIYPRGNIRKKHNWFPCLLGSIQVGKYLVELRALISLISSDLRLVMRMVAVGGSDGVSILNS